MTSTRVVIGTAGGATSGTTMVRARGAGTDAGPASGVGPAADSPRPHSVDLDAAGVEGWETEGGAVARTPGAHRNGPGREDGRVAR